MRARRGLPGGRAVLALAGLLLLAAPGRAEDEPAAPLAAAETRAQLQRAGGLVARAVTLRRLGRVAEALAPAREALAIYERVWGPADRALVGWLNQLGGMLHEQGLLGEARATFERALAISEAAWGPESHETLMVLANLAESLRVLGAYREALRHSTRVLAARERTGVGAELSVAHVLGTRGSLFQDLGEYEEAGRMYLRALEVLRGVVGPDHAKTIQQVNNLATLRTLEGDLPEALRLHEQAHEAQARTLGPRHPDTLMGQFNVASVHRSLGDLARARPLLEEVLARQREVLGPEHPDVAGTLDELALLLEDEGRYESALALHREALAVAERALGPDHPEVARLLSNAAQTLLGVGANAEAQAATERALAVTERALGPGHPRVAVQLANLAGMLGLEGRHDEARALYERALAVQEAALGPEHPSVAITLGTLGGCLLHLARAPEAVQRLERSVRVAERAFAAGRDASRTLCSALGSLASARQRQGDETGARAAGERALRLGEETLGADSPLLAQLLASHAVLLLGAGAAEQALPLAERALAVQEAAFGPHHAAVATALDQLAVVRLQRGERAAAAPLLLRALDIRHDRLRERLASLTGPQRLAAQAETRHALAQWLDLAPHVGASGYEEALRFKGLVWRAEAADRAVARRAGPEERALHESLRAAERRSAALANALPAAGRADARALWQARYAEAGAQREHLARALASRMAPLREAEERLRLGPSEVAARLPADAALIDVLRVRRGYVAWVLHAGGEPVRVELGSAAELEAAAQAFVWDLTRGLPTAAASAAALRKRLWEPLEARLGAAVSHVILCPDAALASLPLAALPGRAPATFLLDDYRLSHVMHAHELVPAALAPRVGEGALLVGGVDYERAAGSAPAAAAPSAAPAPAPPDRAPSGARFRPLAHTGAEAEALRERLAPAAATLLRGAEATERRVREEAPGRRLLHVATHGFAREDLLAGLYDRQLKDDWTSADRERQVAAGHDPMLLSGLALAGANPRDGGGGDDGLLTALEASSLDLDGVELVTLSACETARGTASSGEGVLGLISAFRMAGARNVVASLWRVDDQATRRLMDGFYERLLRAQDLLSPAQALREASLALRDLRDEGGRQRFAAPRYWAAFVAYGR